jgi:hypothetical protein
MIGLALNAGMLAETGIGTFRTSSRRPVMSVVGGIVLKNSKIAGL